MKRYAFYMLVMAVAAVAACQKESAVENPQEPAQKTYTYTVNASINDVKSDYDADGKFSWSAGDAISVLFHNGDVNKFFTLTTTADGTASASFTGEIETGYVIGASDQTVEDKKIWALYPASSNHTYTSGNTHPVSFFIPAETDFRSPGHFSANMPMYALRVDEGSFSFGHLACAYKFIIKDLDNSVNQVMLTVTNNLTYALSGAVELRTDGYYLNQGYSDPESSKRSISFISDVTSNTAVFYVPTRYYAASFKPTITLTDYETGNVLKTITATNAKAIDSKGKVQPITVSAPGTGTPWSFTSIFGINWSGIASVAGESSDPSHSGISLMKASSDATYIYLYVEVDKRKLLADSSRDYANAIYTYFGNDESTSISWPWNGKSSWNDRKTAWLTKYGQPSVSSWESIIATTGNNVGTAIRRGDIYCYDMKLKRSANSILQNTGVLYMGACIYNTYYNGGIRPDQYIVVPALGAAMYSLNITDTYVAP